MPGQLITWRSSPVYDSFGSTPGLWTGSEWVQWHIALKEHFGQNTADEMFVNAWLDGLSTLGGGRGTAPGSGWMFDAVPVGDRDFNTEFINYLKAPGNERIEAVVYSGFGGELGNVIGTSTTIVDDTLDTISGAVKNIKEGVSNVGDTLGNTTAVLKYVLPIGLILLVAIIIYKEAKSKPILK